MLGYTQRRGLIVQHRHDHRAQRVRRLVHARRILLESVVHSCHTVGVVLNILALFVDAIQRPTRTHQALLLIMLEEKADKLRRVVLSVLNTPARLAGVGVSVSW